MKSVKRHWGHRCRILATVGCMIVVFVLEVGCGQAPSAVEQPDLSKLKVEALLEHLENGTPELRRAVCRRLAELDSQRALDAVLALVDDEDKMVQATAIKALGERGSTRAVPVLEVLLDANDPVLPFHALSALVAIGSQDSIEAVVAIAPEKGELASEARRLLGESKSPSVRATIVGVVGDRTRDKAFRLSVIELLPLVGAGPDELTRLRQILKVDKSKAIRVAIKTAIKRLEQPTPKVSAVPLPKPTPKVSAVLLPKPTPKVSAVLLPKPTPKVSAVPLPKPTPKVSAVLLPKPTPKVAVIPVHRPPAPASGWPEPSRVRALFLQRVPEAGPPVGSQERNMAIGAFNRGVSCVNAGNLGGATAAYQDAVAIDPRFFEAAYNLAGVHEKRRMYAPALSAWGRTIRLRPNKHELYFRVALNLEKQGKHRDAWAFFILAEQRAISQADYPYRAGLIAFKFKDYLMASSCLERAFKLAPGKGDIAYNLAATHVNLGNVSRARYFLERAAAQGVDVSGLRHALQNRQ